MDNLRFVPPYPTTAKDKRRLRSTHMYLPRGTWQLREFLKNGGIIESGNPRRFEQRSASVNPDLRMDVTDVVLDHDHGLTDIEVSPYWGKFISFVLGNSRGATPCGIS